MKKLLILLIFLPSLLFGFEFSTSFSIRTAKESNLLDYQFASEINIKNKMFAEIEFERNNGINYLNYETKLIQNWKYLSLSTQRKYIECKDINQIYIEALGRICVEQRRFNFILIKLLSNGYWEAGLRNQWNKQGKKLIPTLSVVIGKNYDKEIRFFLIPAKFQYSLYYLSKDFKNWDCESSTKISFALLTFMDFYLKYTLEPKYFQFKTGLTVRI